MPDRSTVNDWLSRDEDFAADFAVARARGTHNIAYDCLDLADRDDLEPNDKRIRIDTRLRLIGMWNRKDYGEKQATVEVNNSVELNLQMAMPKALNAPESPIIDVSPNRISDDRS